MNMHLRILLLIGSLLFMAVTVYSIRSGNLNLFQSIRWFAGSAVILVMALFPDMMADLAGFCGVEVPSNFVFLFMIAFLLMSSLSLSSSLSRQHERIRKLVQETALLENRIRELEDAADTAGASCAAAAADTARAAEKAGLSAAEADEANAAGTTASASDDRREIR